MNSPTRPSASSLMLTASLLLIPACGTTQPSSTAGAEGARTAVDVGTTAAPTAPTAPPSAERAEQPHPRVGGYAPADTASPHVQEAVAEAIPLLRAQTGDGSLKLVRVKSAATQIVAGMRFELTLEVSGKGGAREVTVHVLRNLEGKYSLSSVAGW